MAPLLEVRGLTVELPTPAGWVRPVNDVWFELSAGDTLGLVGESGCGKTMLSLALLGLLPPGARTTGEAWLAQRNDSRNSGSERLNLAALTERERVPVRGREIAMIFQEPMTALNPVMIIGRQVAECAAAHQPGLSSREVKRRAIEALEAVAIPEAAQRGADRGRHPSASAGTCRG